MRLYILEKFNNYFNRRLRRYSNLADYLEFGGYSTYNANFVPGDGVNTTHVLGSIVAYDGTGDYLIVTDDYDNIQSRWFILENHYIRGGQCELFLRRDVIADYFDETIAAPCFIEKATIRVPDDTAIYNREGNIFNQIKTDEWLLKDKSEIPWLAVYYVRDKADGTTNTISGKLNKPYELADINVSSLESWEYYDYTERAKQEDFSAEGGYRVYSDFSITLKSHNNVSGAGKLTYNASISSNSPDIIFSYGEDGMAASYFTTPAAKENTSRSLWGTLIRQNKSIIFSEAEQFAGWADGGLMREQLYNLDNKIIYVADEDMYYTINLNIFSSKTQEINQLWLNSYPLTTRMLGIGRAMGLTTNGIYVPQTFPDTFDISGTYALYRLELKAISVTSSTAANAVSFNASDVTTTSDAPYNVFCVPYGEITIGNLTTNKADSLALVSDIIQRYSGGNSPVVLDAQVLPVCPWPNLISGKNTINLTRLSENSYTPIKDGESNTIGYIFHCPLSQFSTVLDYQIPMNVSDTLGWKIDAETKFCRLVSPNWNGTFEFSPARNWGVDGFNVDCALKPYQPYIHVAPEFGGLYGNRDKDAIGLICGGDFGLTMVSDAFASFERANVNYQRIFDRQIQNMELNQSIQQRQAWINAGIGSITGAVSGGTAGGALGGVAGLAIGAAVGGVASLGGGIADAIEMNQVHKESLGFAKDNFKYQIGAIKALSDSITKVSSFNPNNPLHIILEFYDCSPTERTAFEKQLKYTGMTVGRIDTISNFIMRYPQYIQGKIITIENIDDAHLAAAIADEISRGIYIQTGEGYNGYLPI